MTTRLTRWLTTLDNFEAKMADYNCRSAQPVSLSARTAAKRTK